MGTPFLLFPILLPYNDLHSSLLATTWDRTHRGLVSHFPKNIPTFKVYASAIDTIIRRNRELLATISNSDLPETDHIALLRNIA